MNKCKGLFALFMTSVLMLSAVCVTANAVDGDADPGYAESSAVSEDPVTPDPGYSSDTPSYDDPGYSSDTPSYDDPASSGSSSYYDPGYYSSDTSSYESSQSYYNGDNNGYNGGGYSDYSSQSSYSYGGNTFDNGYSYGEYQHDSSAYSYNDSYQAPSASLIESDKSVDENTLSSSDWSDIAKSLNSAGTSSDGSDSADDFSFIKNNTSTGDNGHWMLYVSIALIVVSLLGIAYFVGSTVLNRKKAAARAVAPHGTRPVREGGHHNDGYETQARRMKSDDYNDSYGQAPQKKHRKYDTAEIKLPKNRPSNGRRYK